MTEKLTWNITITATGGPRLAQGGGLEVDAYDKISVVVPATGKTTVELGPTATGRMTCLVIAPEKPAKALTYAVGTTTVELDAPQFLFGGAVGLTGNPSTLTLKNAGAADAAVSIFVGRTAINPPAPTP